MVLERSMISSYTLKSGKKIIFSLYLITDLTDAGKQQQNTVKEKTNQSQGRQSPISSLLRVSLSLLCSFIQQQTVKKRQRELQFFLMSTGSARLKPIILRTNNVVFSVNLSHFRYISFWTIFCYGYCQRCLWPKYRRHKNSHNYRIALPQNKDR